MIHSLVPDDLRSSLVEHLASSVALADDDVHDALAAFLTDRDDGGLHGPYRRVRTPFVAVDDSWATPLGCPPEEFRRFKLQARAFGTALRDLTKSGARKSSFHKGFGHAYAPPGPSGPSDGAGRFSGRLQTGNFDGALTAVVAAWSVGP